MPPSPQVAAGRSGPTPHFRSGDPIRGIASLGVVLCHAATSALYVSGHFQQFLDDGWSGPLGPAGAVIGAGVVGVPIFFVLSGFLIARPFLAAYVDGRPQPRVPAFLWNRAVRLFPAFWVALAAALLIAGLQGRTVSDLPRMLLVSEPWATSPLRFHLGQAWTLGVEARFYLAVPLIGSVLVLAARACGGRPRGRGTRLALVAVLATTAAVAGFALVPRGNDLEYSQPLAHAHVLLLGLLVAAADLALAGRRSTSRRLNRAGACAVLAAFATCVWLATRAPMSVSLLGLDGADSELAILAACGVVIVGVPALLERLGAAPWRVLDTAPLRWLGGRAYGLYLYHFMLLTTFSHWLPTPDSYRWGTVILTVTALPLSLVAAELSWRLVEAPALRLKRSAQRTPQPYLTEKARNFVVVPARGDAPS
ncbi:O-acetyltransferase [Paraconexibacter sp. AEG42_29]|uniref:O-acetyltransferase n=1 Tax=Paraconexibacter sp. AEG42_29 TaxID=2997339 RepID=A0AAU7ASX3_9ACTN